MGKIYLSKSEKVLMRALRDGKDVGLLGFSDEVLSATKKRLKAKGFVTYTKQDIELGDEGELYLSENPKFRNGLSKGLMWGVGLLVSILCAIFGDAVWNVLSSFFC